MSRTENPPLPPSRNRSNAAGEVEVITDGLREIDARLMRDTMEFERRRGPRQSDPFDWSSMYHETIAFERAMQKRSQHEWFAKAEYLAP